MMLPRLRRNEAGRSNPGPAALLLLLGMMLTPFAGPPLPLAAQTVPPQEPIWTAGPSLQLHVGRTFYDRDPFCGLYDLYLSSLGLTATRGGLGITTGLILDYPWPVPPPPGGIYLDRGPSLQAVVELYPLHYLGASASRVETFVRPFVGAGVQYTFDGEAFAAGTERPGPVYAVQGSLDPVIIYGATFRAPIGDSGLGIIARVQGNSVLDVAGEYLTPQGETITTEGSNLNWTELRVGFSLTR